MYSYFIPLYYIYITWTTYVLLTKLFKIDGVARNPSAAWAKLHENEMHMRLDTSGFCFTTKKPNLKEETQLCLVIQVHLGNYLVALVFL